MGLEIGNNPSHAWTGLFKFFLFYPFFPPGQIDLSRFPQFPAEIFPKLPGRRPRHGHSGVSTADRTKIVSPALAPRTALDYRSVVKLVKFPRSLHRARPARTGFRPRRALRCSGHAVQLKSADPPCGESEATMTPIECVAAAFQHRTPERIPVHHIGFSSAAASVLLGREAYVGGGIQQWREACALWNGPDAHAEFIERSFRDAVAVARAAGNDLIRPSYWRYPLKPTRRMDEWTFLYEYGPEENWRILRYDPDSEQADIEPATPLPELRFEDLESEVERAEKSVEAYTPAEQNFAFEFRAARELGHEFGIRVPGIGLGLPTRNAACWLEALALRPDLVGRYLDVQVERARRNAAFLAAHGFRYLFGGGDFASQTGPIYSPAAFREIVLPRLRQISEACHARGAYHLFASDGNLWPVADALFGESGIDGYYEIDRRAGMDLERLRERFPDLVLIGNISSHTVHLGTRDEIISEVESVMAQARRIRGVIVGISNYIVPGTPPENVRAVIDTVARLR